MNVNVKVNVQTTGKSSARRTPNFPVSPLKAEKEEKGVKKNKEGREERRRAAPTVMGLCIGVIQEQREGDIGYTIHH